jgi:hypothetical protein
VNTTRPSDKSAHLAKVRRDAERRDRAWREREEQAKRRKAAKNGPTPTPAGGPAVRRSGDGPMDSPGRPAKSP